MPADAPDTPPSRIIGRIWDEPDAADLRARLVMFFEKRHWSPAEDRADEVILRIIKIVNRLSSEGLRERERENEILARLFEKLSAGGELAGDEQCARDLTRYAFGIAKKIVMEEVKKIIWEKHSQGESGGEPNPGYGAGANADIAFCRQLFPDEPEDLTRECLRECLRGLPNDKRKMLLSYYETDNKKDSGHHQKVADEFSGTVMNNLHVKVHRARKKVRKCVLSCMERKRPGSSKFWCKD